MSVHESYSFQRGDSPLLISVPHDGRDIPDDLRARMTPAGLDIPDTDWHVARLYDFAHSEGASVIVAHWSRYVVDLNRSADDGVLYPGQLVTGLCPAHTFAGDPIYRDGLGISAEEQAARVRVYWWPYHNRIAATLDLLRARFGYALLWDAHSIPSAVPRLFDGDLPVLNIGTNDGRSCPAVVEERVGEPARDSGYDCVINGRFKGGFITRHYGDPDGRIAAIQLEIAQRAYMDESTRIYDHDKAGRLRTTLQAMLSAFRDAGKHAW
jgi:N-formylglutamate deformylase